MSAITWANVTDATDNDPLLVNFASNGQTLILAVVNVQLDVNMFDGEDGPQTELARCYLAAHYGVCAKLGINGPLTGQSEGGVAQQYAVILTNKHYDSTMYGRLFQMMIGSQAFGPRLL